MTELTEAQDQLGFLEKIQSAIWVKWCFNINNSEYRNEWWYFEDLIRQVKQEIYSLSKVAK